MLRIIWSNAAGLSRPLQFLTFPAASFLPRRLLAMPSRVIALGRDARAWPARDLNCPSLATASNCRRWSSSFARSSFTSPKFIRSRGGGRDVGGKITSWKSNARVRLQRKGGEQEGVLYPRFCIMSMRGAGSYSRGSRRKKRGCADPRDGC